MDTRNYAINQGSRSVAPFPRENVVVGAKQLRKALNSGRARQVFLAENADPAITEPILALCQKHRVAITWVRTMSELGRACGIEVGAAAAAKVL